MIKSIRNIDDYIGKTIRNYTIIRSCHSKGKTRYWICRCRCGNEKPVQVSQLFNRRNCGTCNKCKFSEKLLSKSKLWQGGEFISGAVFSNIKYGARERNINFDITIPYLENIWMKQDGRCAYTNELLTLPKISNDKTFNCSLDRIDSSKGYIEGNVQWVLKEVNFMKQSLSEQRFLQLCKKISARF